MSLKLNIGCGPNMFPGWINLDRVDMSGYLETLRSAPDIEGWPEYQQRIAHNARLNTVACEVHDIRTGLPQYEDGSVDAIYLGQIIEHWNPIREVPALLDCFWKKLRPGGSLCITTPDLDLLIDAYKEGRMLDFALEQPAFYTTVTPDAQLSFLLFGATGPNCTIENYEGHFMAYGKKAMAALLTAIGLVDISFERKSDIFRDCVDCGMSHSMRVEARRPL
jgi:SAM-dependent methyltransferase